MKPLWRKIASNLKNRDFSVIKKATVMRIYKSILIKFILVVTFLSLFSHKSTAQVDEMKTDEEVMVIAPFNPTISKAKKIDFAPKPDTNITTKLSIEYLNRPKLFETNFSVEKLNAARFIDRRSPKYLQNYVKGGYGFYKTAYGELFVNSKMSKNTLVGIHLRHLSSESDIEDYAYAANSQNSFRIWAKQTQRKSTSLFTLKYKRNRVYRYGFLTKDYPNQPQSNPDNPFKDDIQQTFSHLGFDFRLSGTYDKRFINRELDFSYTYFWDQFKSNEHLIDINAFYNFPVDWFKLDNENFGVAFNTQTYQTNLSFEGVFPRIDSTSNYFHGLYDISPYYEMSWESIRLELGAKLSMALDSNSQIMIAPRAKLKLDLLDSDLTLYLNVDGGYYNNSLFEFSTNNNFISPVVPIKYSKYNYNVRFGLRGKYRDFLDYNIFVGTLSFKDMPMFITDTASQYDNSFDVRYDGGQKFELGLEVGYNTERWNIELMAKYQSFSMDTVAEAWQKPGFLYKFKAGYYVLENLQVSGLLLGQGKMYNWHFERKTIEPWMDLSIMVDYNITPKLVVFAKTTNIFSDQYMIWYNYPVQSIGFLAGIGFNF
jgi:hypothetical protein